MEKPKQKLKLGELLMGAGMISKTQLEEVLAEHETPENTPVFCRVPFYLALNKDKNIFFKMIDFFDESLSQYFQSRLDANSVRTEYKEAFQNVVNNRGFKKVEALVNSGIFLPFQDRLIMTTLEKEKLETLIPNNQKEGKRLKI